MLLADGTLHGLTETGTFHIARLRLNRPALVFRRQRELRIHAARAGQRELLQQLLAIQGEVDRLKSQVESLHSLPVSEPE